MIIILFTQCDFFLIYLLRTGEHQVFTKWEGLGYDTCTWEDINNLKSQNEQIFKNG